MLQGAQDRADSLLNINQSPAQVLHNLRVMEHEGQNFVQSNQDEVLHLRKQIQALGEGPQLDKTVTPPAFAVPERPPAGAPAAAAPQPGTVEQGHRFKGGNPADPANWERVQ